MTSPTILRYTPVFALLLMISLVSVAAQGSFLLLDLSATIATSALLALSVGIAWGQGGILSIAQAAFAAIGAYATAIATINWGWSPYVALTLAVALASAVGYPLARVVTRLPPLALAIATFAFGELIYILVRNGGDLTGGYVGISGVPALPLAPDPFSFHLFSWAVVTVVLVCYVHLADSSFGRALRTVRHDRIRAAADGINVPHMLSSVYALSAALAGLAGWLYATHISFVAPESLGTELSIQVLLMTVVGGAGTVLGPVVGAVLLGGADHFLPGEEIRGLLYGSVLMMALVLMPHGLLGGKPISRFRTSMRKTVATALRRRGD